jgi:hypothetical protein
MAMNEWQNEADAATSLAAEVLKGECNSRGEEWVFDTNAPNMPCARHSSGLIVSSGWNHTEGLRYRILDLRNDRRYTYSWCRDVRECFAEVKTITITGPLKAFAELNQAMYGTKEK